MKISASLPSPTGLESRYILTYSSDIYWKFSIQLYMMFSSPSGISRCALTMNSGSKPTKTSAWYMVFQRDS